MSALETVSDMRTRTIRLTAIATIIETFADHAERGLFIDKLESCGVLSADLADILRDTYIKEVAE